MTSHSISLAAISVRGWVVGLAVWFVPSSGPLEKGHPSLRAYTSQTTTIQEESN